MPALSTFLHKFLLCTAIPIRWIFLSLTPKKKPLILNFQIQESENKVVSYENSILSISWQVKYCRKLELSVCGLVNMKGRKTIINHGDIREVTLTAYGRKEMVSATIQVIQIHKSNRQLIDHLHTEINPAHPYHPFPVHSYQLRKRLLRLHPDHANLSAQKIKIKYNPIAAGRKLKHRNTELALTSENYKILDRVPINPNNEDIKKRISFLRRTFKNHLINK